MSIIASKISVDKSVIVGRIDSPLDARTRCNNTADFPNIETPFIGMIIFTTDDRQYWVVTELQSKLIGSQMIENYQIKSYEKLVDILGAVSGGGAEYTAGNGISISDDNEISIKGVRHFDEPQDGFIGLYTDENGLHFAGDMLITKQELSEQLGGIDSILDNINGEVI